MGVRNLWRVIRHAEECISLSTLAANMKAEAEQSGNSRTTPCYGINLNSCIAACFQIASTQTANTHWQRHGGALYIFLRILLAYARVRATLVFVFDGPHCPTSLKRLRWAGTIESAPGEATAELVMLNRAGIIDTAIIVANDDDALVYGARSVAIINLREFISKSTQDELEVRYYTSARVHQTASLTAGGIVLFALLSGGNYRYEDPRHRYDFKLALKLSQCSYGDDLVNAANTYLLNHHLDYHGFDLFVHQWRARLCDELITNHSNRLETCRLDVAHNIRTSDFPKLELLMYFLQPLNSATRGEWYLPNPSGWYLFHEPSLLHIKAFCQDKLKWTNGVNLKERFVKQVLPRIAVRMFYSPLAIYDVKEAKLATPLHQAIIRSFRWTKRRGHSQVRHPRVSLSISNLLDVAGLPKSGDEHIVIWTPSDAMPYALQETA